jgi:plasmid maintenance system killer protein
MNYKCLRNPSENTVSDLLGQGWKLHSVSVITDYHLVYHFIKE